MKTILSVIISTLLLSCLTAQNIPIDFEENGNGADWSWRTFENDTDPDLEIVANPDMTGINTSATVAKFTALRAGQPFAGCESLHGADIGDFIIDESTSTLRIMVWKSVRSDVGIKLVRADNWSLGEIKIRNTKVNEWEELVFDFSSHLGNPYDQIVIFPDFDNRQDDNVIYFDNIRGEETMANEEVRLKDGLTLFPNPVSDILRVKSERTFDRYEIYSVDKELVAYGTESTINTSTLAKGIYLLKALSKKEIEVEKFIKE